MTKILRARGILIPLSYLKKLMKKTKPKTAPYESSYHSTFILSVSLTFFN
ncbi:hypothetical protein I33_3091 [Bacillus subtilis subsp. subtilis str. RO-NN-1]|nr:hypothetical protein I33_3091 [Bacillus subtilis subsp. subtilis str. RO-NN-1]BAI86547.1 hypothetical protein BSNT_09456 [Bacillus subtilis subsp. natto BEST195]